MLLFPCPICKTTGGEYTGGMHTDLGPGYGCKGADGVRHEHDPNSQTACFVCEQGHHFYYHFYIPCHKCGWVAGVTSVTCLPGGSEPLT